MLWRILAVMVLAQLALAQAESFRSSEQFGAQFDFYVFRQEWPQTSCMFPGSNNCSIASNITSWTIHGLWPSDKGNEGPSFCNKSAPFDFGKIKYLLPQLLEYWPNLYTNTALDSFWKHEWEKHGTCAAGSPFITNESDYFNITLGLRSHFDFGEILRASKIVPDDSNLYTQKQIADALTSVLGVPSTFFCEVPSLANYQYFSGIQVCLDKNFDIINCNISLDELAAFAVGSEVPCRNDLLVSYPVIKYN